jgi:hypothetical protein
LKHCLSLDPTISKPTLEFVREGSSPLMHCHTLSPVDGGPVGGPLRVYRVAQENVRAAGTA